MDKDFIIRYFTSELETHERIQLLKAMEDDETLRQEFITYRNLTGLLSLTPRPLDTLEGKESHNQFILHKKRQRLRNAFIRFSKYGCKHPTWL